MSIHIDSILMGYLEKQLEIISNDFRDHKLILFILETESTSKYNIALEALSRMKDRALDEASRYSDKETIDYIKKHYEEIRTMINSSKNIRENIKDIDYYLNEFSNITRTTEENIKCYYASTDFEERNTLFSELKNQFPNL